MCKKFCIFCICSPAFNSLWNEFLSSLLGQSKFDYYFKRCGVCGLFFRWWHALPKHFRVLVLQFSSFLGPERQLSLHIMLFRWPCYTGWENTIINKVKKKQILKINKWTLFTCQIQNTKLTYMYIQLYNSQIINNNLISARLGSTGAPIASGLLFNIFYL